MKREILFRGKLKKSNKFIYGLPTYDFRYIFNSSQVDSCDNYEVIPETVCQFTGLTDKNGTKIFEGDIVNNSKVVCDITDNGCSFESYTEFCSGHYVENKKFVARIDFDFENELLYESENTSCEHFNEECELFGFIAGFEVIGNIFDSPELLK